MWNNHGTGFLVIISAPSAAGKTTLCRMLLQRNAERMIFSRSCTTRPRRPEEAEDAYFFISADEFKQRIQTGQFLEWAMVHNHYYGTLKSQVKAGIEHGRIVLLDIDVQGGLQVMDQVPEALSIFILPPSWEELQRRLRERRTESQAQIDLRLRNSRLEIASMPRYHSLIINDQLEDAYHQLIGVIQSHSFRFSNYSPSFLQQFQTEDNPI
ncbi:MAG: guanylate kinase [Candidatus Delongbacteria bacterium]|nr:guanylate kinase [Candidatus Delongbacteria bacterium]